MKSCSSRGQQVFLENNQKSVGLLITKIADYIGALCLIVFLAPFLLVIFLLVWLQSDDLDGAGKARTIKPGKFWLEKFCIVPKFNFGKYSFLQSKN